MARALSLSDTISLPSFPQVNIPSPADAARAGFSGARSAYNSAMGQRARQLARTGSRVAGRYIPLIMAIELAGDGFIVPVPNLGIPFGKLALDLRGAWTRDSTCGIAPETLRWNQNYPSCGTDFTISTSTGLPQTGPIKSFTLWGDYYPLRYYINGVSVLAKGSEHYTATAFPSPAISSRFNAAMTFPVIDATAEDRPMIFGLSAAARPQQRPGQPPLPIPFGLWPHIRPNSSVPSSVQLSQGGYKRDADQTKPVETVTKPTVEKTPWIESFPAGIPEVLSKPTPTTHPVTITVAPGSGAVAAAVPHQMRPPGRGEKEAKFKMKPGPRNLVLRAFNQISEYADLIDSLYWAIDTDAGYTGRIEYGRKIYDWRRPPGRKVWWKDSNGKWQSRWVNSVTLQQKTDFIWQHLQDLDLGVAAANIVKNEIGDLAYGKLGQAYGAAARATAKSGTAQPSRAPTLSRASGNNPTGQLPLKPAYDAVDQAFGVKNKDRAKWTARNAKAHPQQLMSAWGAAF